MDKAHSEYKKIDWALCYKEVFQIQQGIAMAYMKGNLN